MNQYYLKFIILSFILIFGCTNPRNEQLAYTNLEEALRNKEWVEELAIRNESLYDSFPVEILALKKLRILTIQGNECNELLFNSCKHINSIPRWISELTELEEIYLQGNNITELPDELRLLPNLKVLDLTSNRNTSIENIRSLENVSFLYLNDCGLKILPDNFCNLRNLKQLGLESNNLNADQIEQLKLCLPKCNIGIKNNN